MLLCRRGDKMSDEIKDIVERLKTSVQKSGLSYVELEKKTNIAKSSIQRYVSGLTKKIPIDAIQAIAKAVDVSPAYIMGWTNEEKEESQNNDFQENKLLHNYKTLNTTGKQKLVDYSEDLVNSGNYKETVHIVKQAARNGETKFVTITDDQIKEDLAKEKPSYDI